MSDLMSSRAVPGTRRKLSVDTTRKGRAVAARPRCENVSRTGLESELSERLAQSSEQLLYWKRERHRLIREAYDAGGGVREIARAAGLSHPAIINILGTNRTRRSDKAPDAGS